MKQKQVTISSKNQVTLPAGLLRKQGLTPGRKLYVVDDGGDITLTTKSSLRRFLDKAETIRATTKPPKKFIDPLEERQKLRDEWGDRM
jgi:bifunctional DNA-binding transcriptional regulator/antitoxin component of YhaV-PrlF toxin-antitoxin module